MQFWPKSKIYFAARRNSVIFAFCFVISIDYGNSSARWVQISWQEEDGRVDEKRLYRLQGSRSARHLQCKTLAVQGTQSARHSQCKAEWEMDLSSRPDAGLLIARQDWCELNRPKSCHAPQKSARNFSCTPRQSRETMEYQLLISSTSHTECMHSWSKSLFLLRNTTLGP